MPFRHRSRTVARRLLGLTIALVLAGSYVGVGASKAEALATSSISGHVTNSQGEPLPNSAVRLLLPTNSYPLRIVASVNTDAEGDYAFTGLEAGTYGIHVYGPPKSEYVGETWDNEVTWLKPTPIVVSAGESRTGIDLQLILGGVVTGTVSDQSGAPLSNAFVQLRRVGDHPNGEDQTLWKTTTDESGRYEIRRVLPGPYTVTAVRPTALSPDQVGYLPLESAPLRVAGDDFVEASLRLTQSSSITVNVTDPAGHGSRDVVVDLYRLEDGAWRWLGPNNPYGRWIDDSYQMTDVPSGSYTFAINTYWSKENWAPQWWKEQDYEATAYAIELGIGEARSAEVQLDPGGRITGTLNEDEFLETEGGVVNLHRLRNGEWRQVAQTHPIGGAYEFDKLQAGTYKVQFLGPDRFIDEWWDGPGGVGTVNPDSAQVIDVVSGQVLADVDGALAHAPASLSTPIVSGTASVGTTLKVAASSQSPDAQLTYEWRANGTRLTASGTSLVLSPSELGKRITATVIAAAPGYVTATKDSKQTGVVTPGVLTSPTPTITGSTLMGSTLTAKAAGWTRGTEFAYQWYASGVAIAKATSPTFVLTGTQIGKKITVKVTGSKLGYATASRSSPSTVAVPPAKKLTSTPVPKVTGTPALGGKLSAVTGAWTPAPVGITYQWYADGVAIPGAKSSTFIVTTAQVGKPIRVRVTGSKVGYTAVAKTSVATAPIPRPKAMTSAPTPKITGTPKVGIRLTAVPGSWSPEPITKAYQWLAAGVAIKGATAVTFTPTAANVAQKITVRVTASKIGYVSVVKVSSATAVVAE
ncbi:MAG: carboxypeptidase regulatory-like domain-containing protein [Mycetocola sp.]